jgi:hypothetical protein
MNKKRETATLAAIFLLGCALAHASDFDGSKRLLCATFEAHSCAPGVVCERGLPAEFGAPRFLTIDFAKKVISGPQRTTPIAYMEKGEKQILMQGNELGFAWSAALDTTDGSVTVTLVNRDDALVLFGDCTAL